MAKLEWQPSQELTPPLGQSKKELLHHLERDILEQEHLSEDSCFMVSNGSTINIWEDPWVPLSHSFKP